MSGILSHIEKQLDRNCCKIRQKLKEGGRRASRIYVFSYILHDIRFINFVHIVEKSPCCVVIAVRLSACTSAALTGQVSVKFGTTYTKLS